MILLCIFQVPTAVRLLLCHHCCKEPGAGMEGVALFQSVVPRAGTFVVLVAETATSTDGGNLAPPTLVTSDTKPEHNLHHFFEH